MPGPASYRVIILGRLAHVPCISRGLLLNCSSAVPFPVSSWEMLPTSLPPCLVVAGQAQSLWALGVQRRLVYLPGGCREDSP